MLYGCARRWRGWRSSASAGHNRTMRVAFGGSEFNVIFRMCKRCPGTKLNSRWLVLQMQINNVIAAVVLCAVIAVIWGGFAFDMAKAIGLV